MGSPRSVTRPESETGFRPEIQALRALGIALVLVYHLWPQRLPGGYVGVDVFFVISGYLISAHLLREVRATGTVSVRAFYARRIRRLLPAALLVLAVCALATWIWLPISRAAPTATEIGASALYVQNWLLASHAVDYLAVDSGHTLVQHYWSLSVEEQFYVFWPVIVIAAVAVAGAVRWPTARAIAVAFAVVFALSFAFSITETARSQPSAYFITPTRAWEFAAGGLLAIAMAAGDARVIAVERRPVIAALLGLAGIAAIAVSAVAFDDDSPFPGSIALLPVLGTVAVIVAGAPHARLSLGPAMRWRPIQFLGGISYSVYLWHWPLILLYPAITGTQRFAGPVVIVAALALATVTKRFVEDPIRRGALSQLPSWRTFAAAAAGMSLVIVLSAVQFAHASSLEARYARAIDALSHSIEPCVGAAALAAGADCEHPFAVTETVQPLQARDDRADVGRCQQKKGAVPIVRCDFGDTSSPVGVLALVGDSHAEQLAYVLDAWGKQNHATVRTYAKSGCPLTLVDRRRIAEDCLLWSRDVIDEVTSDEEVIAVVYSSRPSGYIEGLAEGERLANSDIRGALALLAEAGKPVIVARDVPGTNAIGLDCLERSTALDDPCAVARDLVLTDDLVIAAARELDLPVMDLSDYFCDQELCHFVIGGLVVYGDAGGHLTQAFARTLAPFAAESLERALAGASGRDASN